MKKTILSVACAATFGLSAIGAAQATLIDEATFSGLGGGGTTDFSLGPEAEVTGTGLLAPLGIASLDGTSSRTIDGGLGGTTVTGDTRIFVDMEGTANSYSGGIEFKASDAGTNPTEKFLRTAFKRDGDAEYVEGGMLEYGRIKLSGFDSDLRAFGVVLNDVENTKGTKLSVKSNGVWTTFDALKLGDDEDQFLGFTTTAPIEEVLIDLGYTTSFKGGDGVVVKAMSTAVPEPGTMLALAFGAGLMGLRKRRKANA